LQQFLAKMLPRKWAIKKFSIFSTHKPRNCIFSLKCCMLFLTKKHETPLKISPGQSWTTVHCQNDQMSAPHRTQKEHSILLPVTHMLCVNQVYHSVSHCVKMGVFLRQAWSESQRTVLMGYCTISTNVRRYQTYYWWQLFLSGRQRTGALCVTQSNWVKMWFLCFPILPGSAEAQVIWGGTVRRLLIACFIGNISAKKWKSIHVRQSYSKPKVGLFWDTA